MQDFEVVIDTVNREDIWMPIAEEWIKERFPNYRLCGYSTKENNENRILMTVYFEEEVEKEIGEQDKYAQYNRSQVYIDMIKEDGEYQLKYLSDLPEGYDEFMEAFEEWKKTKSSTETLVTQGENKNLSSSQEQEINVMSTGIVAGCTSVLIIIGVIVIFRIIKHLK